MRRTPKHKEDYAADFCEQLTRVTPNNAVEFVTVQVRVIVARMHSKGWTLCNTGKSKSGLFTRKQRTSWQFAHLRVLHKEIIKWKEQVHITKDRRTRVGVRSKHLVILENVKWYPGGYLLSWPLADLNTCLLSFYINGVALFKATKELLLKENERKIGVSSISIPQEHLKTLHSVQRTLVVFIYQRTTNSTWDPTLMLKIYSTKWKHNKQFSHNAAVPVVSRTEEERWVSLKLLLLAPVLCPSDTQDRFSVLPVDGIRNCKDIT